MHTYDFIEYSSTPYSLQDQKANPLFWEPKQAPISLMELFLNALKTKNFATLRLIFNRHLIYQNNILGSNSLSGNDAISFWEFLFSKTEFPYVCKLNTKKNRLNRFRYMLVLQHPDTGNSCMMDITCSFSCNAEGEIIYITEETKQWMWIAHAYGIIGFCEALITGFKKFQKRMFVSYLRYKKVVY